MGKKLKIISQFPWVYHASPELGFPEAVALAEKGKDVLLFAEPGFHPDRYKDIASRHLTVIDADIKTEAGQKLAIDASEDIFDALFFICGTDDLAPHVTPHQYQFDIIVNNLWWKLCSEGKWEWRKPFHGRDNVIPLFPERLVEALQ